MESASTIMAARFQPAKPRTATDAAGNLAATIVETLQGLTGKRAPGFAQERIALAVDQLVAVIRTEVRLG
jgi:hypothetical protein